MLQRHRACLPQPPVDPSLALSSSAVPWLLTTALPSAGGDAARNAFALVNYA